MLGGGLEGAGPAALPAAEGGRVRGGRAAQPRTSSTATRSSRPATRPAWSSTGSPARSTGTRPCPSPDPAVVEKGLAAIRKSILDVQGVRRDDRPARPGGGQPEGLAPRGLRPVAGEHPQGDPRRRGRRDQDRHRGGLEQVPPRAPRVRPLHRRVRHAHRRGLLRRRQRRRVRLSRRSGSGNSASASSRSTSRNTPRPSGSPTRSARARRSTGPPSEPALVDIGYDGWITAEVGLGDLAEMKDVVRRMDRILG